MAALNRPSLATPWRAALASTLLAGAGLALAEAPPAPLERQVKAAYIYKFAGFVEWPDASFARADSALQIGVAGSEQLADQLEKTVAGRSVNGHRLAVRRIAPGAPLAGLHILFVDPALEADGGAGLLAAAQGQSLLTVCDGDHGRGCMIAFVLDGQRLRFDVMLDRVTPSRLRISARMLAVAHRVRGST